jgi:hypothetical protein
MTQEQAEEFARQEALYRSFQDDTLIGTILSSVRNVGNLIGIGDSGRKLGSFTIHEFGLGDIIQKYTQVPGALLTRAIEFSPLGYFKAIGCMAQFAQQSREAKAKLAEAKENGEAISAEDASTIAAQRKAALAFGRATTGTGLIAAFAALALAGLLRRDKDEKDADAAALNSTEGLTGTQLNISALSRWINGEGAEWQNGDVLCGIDFLEPLNSLMAMGTLVSEDKDAKGLWGKTKALGLDSAQSLYDSLGDLPTMQTIQTIQDTIRYHQEDSPVPLWAEIPIEIGKGGATGFIPSLVRQTAQATDTLYRDAYSSKDTKDQIWATLRNNVPFARNELPAKLTNFGESEKLEDTGLNVTNAFFTPGSLRTYKRSAEGAELERVYKATDDAKVYPDRNAPYKIKATVDGNDQSYELSSNERQKYQMTRGQTNKNLVSDCMGTASYQNASTEDKATILEDVKAYSNYVAKKELLAKRGVDYSDDQYEKISNALNAGVAVSDYVTIATAAKAVEGEKDKDGKTISGSKMKQALAIVNSYDLTKEQKDMFYYALGYKESTHDKNVPW